MTTWTNTIFRPRRTLLILACSIVALTGGAPAAGGEEASGEGCHAPRAAQRLYGMGDEQSRMFANPLWERLHTGIARYIAPYDAVTRRTSLAQATAWIAAAEARCQRVLVAFYHSEYTPGRLPSVRLYERDVRRFVKLFPHVREYQAWNEANRGTIPGRFASPSAPTAARYYQALRRACSTCTVVGLDVLDEVKPNATLRYIAQFKKAVRRLKTVMPSVWGLHNYSDVNRLQSTRTRRIDRAFGGTVWLTETGGIVRFGGAFRNRSGSGLRRAAQVLRYTLQLASALPQIKHVYVYNWSGAGGGEPFDAGLTDHAGRPRPGYVVLCRFLVHASPLCNVATSHR
jgi:hypothetical protein